MVKKPNKGIYILGNALDKQKALVDILLDNTEKNHIYKFIKDNYRQHNRFSFSPEVQKNLENLFGDIEIETLTTLIEAFEKDLNIEFSDTAYSTLVIHMALAINRLKAGKQISMPHEQLLELKKLKEYKTAAKFCHHLGNIFNIILGEDEIGYVTLHVCGSSIQKSTLSKTSTSNELDHLCQKLIEGVEAKLNYSFTNRETLYNGLILHLRPAINRVKYGLQLKNPLREDIKKNFPVLFYIIKEEVLKFEDYTGKAILEDEIAYIALHFGAALENQLNLQEYKPRILIVCASGIGTSKILESRVRSEFKNINIVGSVSYYDIKDITFYDIDYVISTLALEDLPIPLIVVNPLLEKEDIDKIEVALRERKNNKHTIKEIDSVINVIEKYCTINNRTDLKEELNHLLFRHDATIKNNTINEKAQPSLNVLLTEEYIQVNVKATSWQEAIIKCSQPLLTNQKVLPKYIDSVMASIEKQNPQGPYCVIAPGIALLHAKPIAGVLKTSFSLMTLKEPINFGHSKHDPVKLLFILASEDNHVHLKALAQLTTILRSKTDREKVMYANSVNEITAIITATCSNIGGQI